MNVNKLLWSIATVVQYIENVVIKNVVVCLENNLSLNLVD